MVALLFIRLSKLVHVFVFKNYPMSVYILGGK